MVEEKSKESVPTPFKKTQVPSLGRIVLLRLNDGSDRPMLIVKVWSNGMVNGIIFLDGWKDRRLAVPGVREGSLMSHVTSCQRGKEANQWRFYDE